MTRWGRAGMHAFLALAAASLALMVVAVGRGQQMIQYGFEARDPVWVQGPHDAAFREIAHRLSEEYVHDGQRSEMIHLDAERGSFIHYTYNIGRAPVSDDLTVSLWLRANRAGIQLLARVVFPHEHDPNAPDQPLTALLEGGRYQIANHWQPVTLPGAVRLLKQQQLLLNKNLKREVITADAYIDQLVLNVYTGPGDTRIWIDDLELGPVLDRPAASTGRTTGGSVTPAQPAINRPADEIQLRGNQLLVGGQRFFMTAIRHTGTPLHALRKAGFNTVFLDESAPTGLIEEAAARGFRIVPSLRPPDLTEPGGGRVPAQLTANTAFARNVSRFLNEQAVLCWDLGGNLPYEKARSVAALARSFQSVDPMRPLAADISDGVQSYYMNGDQRLLIGAHRFPLQTSLELMWYRDWLVQRRHLVPDNTFCWTWIQTHLSDWFMTTAYERTTGRFDEPIGPHPEQIRLMSYIALGAGYRGLGYWSDRFLADSHTGRDRLLALALLNQEFRMLEPLLVAVKREPYWIDTSHPFVKAAVLRTDKAFLVLPVWMGPGAQYVPPQGHVNMLTFRVPLVPENYVAFEVSPGGIQSHRLKSALGGRQITLEQFNLTSAIVFTGDILGANGLLARLQHQQWQMRREAAQWTFDQAQEELVKAARVHLELEKLGKTLPDGDALLDRAREWLDKCRQHRLNGEYNTAYNDAQLALRAVRTLVRGHWDEAMKRMTTPVACPFAVSFYTLPRYWQFVDTLKRMKPGENVLSDGDFEMTPMQRPPGWLAQEILLPGEDSLVDTVIKRVANNPRQGKQCLMLSIFPKHLESMPQVLERTFLAIHSPTVRLPPGSLARISAWVNLPAPVVGSPDGIMLYDSAGGEPLGMRINVGIPWKQFVLYRRVPPSGKINVTVALTGIGTVFFDDIRIEPMIEKEESEIAAETERRP